MDSISSNRSVWDKLGIKACDYCSFKTSDDAVFQTHICRSAGISYSISSSKFCCSLCRVELTEAAFEEHLESHVSPKPYACYYCSSLFSTRPDVYVHVQQHISIPVSRTGVETCILRVSKQTKQLMLKAKNHGKAFYRPANASYVPTPFGPAVPGCGITSSITALAPGLQKIAPKPHVTHHQQPMPATVHFRQRSIIQTPSSKTRMPASAPETSFSTQSVICSSTPAFQQATTRSTFNNVSLVNEPKIREELTTTKDSGEQGKSNVKENVSFNAQNSNVQCGLNLSKEVKLESVEECGTKAETDLLSKGTPQGAFRHFNVGCSFLVLMKGYFMCLHCQQWWIKAQEFIKHIWDFHVHETISKSACCPEGFSLKCERLQCVLKTVKERTSDDQLSDKIDAFIIKDLQEYQPLKDTKAYAPSPKLTRVPFQQFQKENGNTDTCQKDSLSIGEKSKNSSFTDRLAGPPTCPGENFQVENEAETVRTEDTSAGIQLSLDNHFLGPTLPKGNADSQLHPHPVSQTVGELANETSSNTTFIKSPPPLDTCCKESAKQTVTVLSDSQMNTTVNESENSSSKEYCFREPVKPCVISHPQKSDGCGFKEGASQESARLTEENNNQFEKEDTEHIYAPSHGEPLVDNNRLPSGVIDKLACSTADQHGKGNSFRQGSRQMRSSLSFYQCGFPECVFNSHFPVDLLMHNENDHRMDDSIPCVYCGKANVTARALLEHLDTHIGQDGLKVKYSCSLLCDSREICIVENRNATKVVESLKIAETKKIQQKKDKTCYRCNLCFSLFYTLKNLKEHLDRSLLKVVACRYCIGHFLDSASWQQHMKKEHPADLKQYRINEKLLCMDRKLNKSTHDRLVSQRIAFRTSLFRQQPTKKVVEAEVQEENGKLNPPVSKELEKNIVVENDETNRYDLNTSLSPQCTYKAGNAEVEEEPQKLILPISKEVEQNTSAKKSKSKKSGSEISLYPQQLTDKVGDTEVTEEPQQLTLPVSQEVEQNTCVYSENGNTMRSGSAISLSHEQFMNKVGSAEVKEEPQKLILPVSEEVEQTISAKNNNTMRSDSEISICTTECDANSCCQKEKLLSTLMCDMACKTATNQPNERAESENVCPVHDVDTTGSQTDIRASVGEDNSDVVEVNSAKRSTTVTLDFKEDGFDWDEDNMPLCFKCTICPSAKFYSYYVALAHKKTHADSKADIVRVRKFSFDADKRYKCLHCAHICVGNVEEMQKHLRSSHKYYKCGHCEQDYTFLHFIENHLKYHHRGQKRKIIDCFPKLDAAFCHVDSLPKEEGGLELETLNGASSKHPNSQNHTCKRKHEAEVAEEPNAKHNRCAPLHNCIEADDERTAESEMAIRLAKTSQNLKPVRENGSHCEQSRTYISFADPLKECAGNKEIINFHDDAKRLETLSEEVGKVDELEEKQNIGSEPSSSVDMITVAMSSSACHNLSVIVNPLRKRKEASMEVMPPSGSKLCQEICVAPYIKQTNYSETTVDPVLCPYIWSKNNSPSELPYCLGEASKVDEDNALNVSFVKQVKSTKVPLLVPKTSGRSRSSANEEHVHRASSDVCKAMSPSEFPFQCSICRVCMKCIQDIIDHIRWLHPSKQEHAHILDRNSEWSFTKDGHLVHKKTETELPQQRYLCTACNFSTSTSLEIETHVKTLHPKKENCFILLQTKCPQEDNTANKTESSPANYSTDPSSLKCRPSFADNEGSPKNSVASTAPVSASRLRYCCHLCPEVLYSEFYFKLHLARHEGFSCTSVLSSVFGLLLCSVCGYFASSSNDLAQHTDKHVTERRYACSHCDSDSHTKGILQTHLRRCHANDADAYMIDREEARTNVEVRPRIVDLDPSLEVENIFKKRPRYLRKELLQRGVKVLDISSDICKNLLADNYDLYFNVKTGD